MDRNSFSVYKVFKFLLLTLCVSVKLSTAFNLETRLPLIKRYKEKDSYFGYSVAEHISTVDGISKSWLIVGAPLGNNLQPKTNHSGAVIRCPVSAYLDDDCEQIVTDGIRSLSNGFRDSRYKENKSPLDDTQLFPPEASEIKDGQWMGVTVRSQGPNGKIVVCAHRYVLTSGAESGSEADNLRAGIGLCHELEQDFMFRRSWYICSKYEITSHNEQGVCQSGTSAAIIPDEENSIILGYPGNRNWRGSIYVSTTITDGRFSFSPAMTKPEELEPFSYLGMSVGAGLFFNDKNMDIVAGAPRANYSGQVYVFKRRHEVLLTMKVLNGDKFGSSFGYELATADVNGDKLPDLVVGAPFYYDKGAGGAVYVYINEDRKDLNLQAKITGKPESRFGIAIGNLSDINKDGYEDIAVGAPYEDNGVVYIYLGSKLGLKNEPSQIIRASLAPELWGIKSFGSSLSGGVDLDNNGYPDLLIGAYESDTVVFYRSRPIMDLKVNINKEELVRINPLVPNCDLDSENHTCFKIRACVTITPVSVESYAKNLTNTESLTLRYTLDSDIKNKISRVFFDGKTKVSSKNETIILVKNQRTDSIYGCQEHMVYIKNNITDIKSSIRFLLKYELIQNEPKHPKRGEPLTNVNNFPILDQQESVQSFDAVFLKDCGSDDVCVSQLVIEPSLVLPTTEDDKKYRVILGRNEEILVNITSYNLKEPAYEARIFIEYPPNVSFITEMGGQFSCRSFNDTVLVCDLGNPFKKGHKLNLLLRFGYSVSRITDNEEEFRVFANSTSQEAEPQGVFRLKFVFDKEAELSLRGSSKPEVMVYGGAVIGESAMTSVEQIGLRVQHAYQVFNKGPWEVEDLEVHVEWPFQVANNKVQGKWLLYLDEYPVVAGGAGQCFLSKDLINPLNLTSNSNVVESSGSQHPNSKDQSKNPEQLKNYVIGENGLEPLDKESFKGVSKTEKSSKLNRIKREIVRPDTEMIVRPEIILDKEGRQQKIFRMNCSVKTAKCLNFKCVIRKLSKDSEATILIKSRLWNSTLNEDYSDALVVEIASKATLHIPQHLSIHQNMSNDVYEVKTQAKIESFAQVAPEPDLWIYIVAIVIGLLLLFMLVVLLWKLGFFKRKQLDPTLSGNLEKHRDY